MNIIGFLIELWLLVIVSQWIVKILKTDYRKPKGLDGWNWKH